MLFYSLRLPEHKLKQFFSLVFAPLSAVTEVIAICWLDSFWLSLVFAVLDLFFLLPQARQHRNHTINVRKHALSSIVTRAVESSILSLARLSVTKTQQFNLDFFPRYKSSSSIFGTPNFVHYPTPKKCFAVERTFCGSAFLP